MATENTVMAAVLAKGETVLGNAACEPHVQDLCRFLVSLGAQIEGIESNVLRITGRRAALAAAPGRSGRTTSRSAASSAWPRSPAATSRSRACGREDLVSIIPAFGKLGVRVEVGEDTVHVPTRQQLIVEDDLGGMVPKIEDGPWPAFPSDLTSIALTVATQAFGTVLMFEKMFENRLFFTDKLVSMGARIILCDPHRAVITGPARLVGQRMESPDIRAGMAMLLAALSREGRRRSAPRTRSTRATSGSTSACARSARRSSASKARAAAARERSRSTTSITPKPSASVRTPCPDAVSCSMLTTCRAVRAGFADQTRAAAARRRAARRSERAVLDPARQPRPRSQCSRRVQASRSDVTAATARPAEPRERRRILGPAGVVVARSCDDEDTV